jgi:hypothetical protein
MNLKIVKYMFLNIIHGSNKLTLIASNETLKLFYKKIY